MISITTMANPHMEKMLCSSLQTIIPGLHYFYRGLIQGSGKDKNNFDFSDNSINYFLYDGTNKTAVGKMKYETMSVPVTEFVELRPKMYCSLT